MKESRAETAAKAIHYIETHLNQRLEWMSPWRRDMRADRPLGTFSRPCTSRLPGNIGQGSIGSNAAGSFVEITDREKNRRPMSMVKVAVVTIRLYAPWVHSLKEKRMVVKSILAKVRNKFQVSAAEIQDQDIHQSIVIAVASIAAHSAQADSIMDEIVRFVEQNTEAEIVGEEREIR